MIKGWLRNRKLKSLPGVAVAKTVKDAYGSTVAPNPMVTLDFVDENCTYIGHVDYGVSPLLDKTYIFMIEVEHEYRRKGFGLAMLMHIYKIHGLRLVPVKEAGCAESFWNKARGMSGENLALGDQLTFGELSAEKARWANLKDKIAAHAFP